MNWWHWSNDTRAPAAALAKVNQGLAELDRQIEQTGFHYAPLNPVFRMFIFAKENIVGSDAISLASQMRTNYQVLSDRCRSLGAYYYSVC